MIYRNLGRAGVKVSVICMGTAQLVEPTPWEDSIDLVRAALDAGVNFFDTANVYGDSDTRDRSERVLGEALRGRRDETVIATKFRGRVGPGPNDSGTSRYHIMRQVERSLQRLETDRIDLYQTHGPDPDTPIEETLRAMDDLIKAGKIRYIGVSNFQAWQVLKARWIQDRAGLDPLICIQNPYNLLNRELEREMWPAQRDQGFGVMTYSPLGVGLLSGAYTIGQAAPSGTLYATVRAGHLAKEMNATAQATLELLREIAAAHSKTPAQTAINWVLSHPEVNMAITGGDTVAHMEDNVGAVGWSITAEERAQLDEVSSGQERVLD